MQAGTLTDQGAIIAQGNNTISIQGNVTVNGVGALATTTSSGTIQITGNLLGNTQNADGFNPLGTVQFDSSSASSSSPQLLEAMSADEGAVRRGASGQFCLRHAQPDQQHLCGTG